MRSGVIILPVLQELEKLLRPPLLKEAHERAPDSLHLVTRDLRDLPVAVHEAARDLLELEVPGDVGVHEDLGELARGDDELGDQVHGVVAVAPQLGGRRLVRPELAVQLPSTSTSRTISQHAQHTRRTKAQKTHLGEVQTRAVAAVVVVAVHVQHLLALDGQQPRQDALRQACAEDDDLRPASTPLSDRHAARHRGQNTHIVLFIHAGSFDWVWWR